MLIAFNLLGFDRNFVIFICFFEKRWVICLDFDCLTHFLESRSWFLNLNGLILMIMFFKVTFAEKLMHTIFVEIRHYKVVLRSWCVNEVHRIKIDSLVLNVGLTLGIWGAKISILKHQNNFKMIIQIKITFRLIKSLTNKLCSKKNTKLLHCLPGAKIVTAESQAWLNYAK